MTIFEIKITQILFPGRYIAHGVSPSTTNGSFHDEKWPHNLQSDGWVEFDSNNQNKNKKGARQRPGHDLVNPRHPLAPTQGTRSCREVFQQQLPAACYKAFWDLDWESVGFQSRVHTWCTMYYDVICPNLGIDGPKNVAPEIHRKCRQPNFGAVNFLTGMGGFLQVDISIRA